YYQDELQTVPTRRSSDLKKRSHHEPSPVALACNGLQASWKDMEVHCLSTTRSMRKIGHKIKSEEGQDRGARKIHSVISISAAPSFLTFPTALPTGYHSNASTGSPWWAIISSASSVASSWSSQFAAVSGDSTTGLRSCISTMP